MVRPFYATDCGKAKSIYSGEVIAPNLKVRQAAFLLRFVLGAPAARISITKFILIDKPSGV
jgi:hypothetical protein